ncbi:putative transmembrane protein [Candidatus Glomeribacter gigasporarum BEG34]|uniref:Putative transmembrane protein n=1 Tax=Candidatus Glomeribacter gigasporarum BEG34 TaxID=1070319 RepID=G2J9H0_9BURK|nr:BPSS1780 family membrane protein [Candidatus Glomeribacter gigasporarum]CCD29417.1 putative transmembrane protein [Candidatus Glomeribacter gigasporarum BEG34]
MYLNKVSASTGALWFRRGITLFFKSPLVFLALNLAYLLITMATALIPVVHVFASFLILPFFSVLFMTASRAACSGQPVSLHLLGAIFQSNGRRAPLYPLAMLGLCNFAVNVLVLITSALLDGGKLMQIALLGQSPEMALSDGALSARVSAALLFVMASYMPLTILFWFAPALSIWHRTPAPKALFFSWMAFWRNWSAFIVLLILWTGTTALILLTLTVASGHGTAHPALLGRVVLYFLISGSDVLVFAVYELCGEF